MQRFTCPSCGAEIAFRSGISVYAVCAHCASMVVRHDKDIESIGTMAQLPDDISPLQIGTEGSYNGMRFGIIGRAKIGWEDGSWNEWFLYADNGRKGWLAEAQGFLAISFELDEALIPEAQHALERLSENFRDREAAIDAGRALGRRRTLQSLGHSITLDGKKFRITDIKEAECIGSEGELPFTAPKGRKATYVDMTGHDGAFAGVEYAEGPPRIYTGEYMEFDDFRFSNLRELEGWRARPVAPVAPSPKKRKAADGW